MTGLPARAVLFFGQFGEAADPVNLPHFMKRLQDAGIQTILVQHTDTQKGYDFLRGWKGKIGIFGSSLGAGISPVMAGYLQPRMVNIVGGFQPSDYDPVMHPVNLPRTNAQGEVYDVVTRAVTVPNNVIKAICFRNPVAAATAGLGHAIYVASSAVRLYVFERNDLHPGDFGEAQDRMFEEAREALHD